MYGLLLLNSWLINNSTHCLQMNKCLHLRRFLPLQRQTDCQRLQTQQAGKEGGRVNSTVLYPEGRENPSITQRMNKSSWWPNLPSWIQLEAKGKQRLWNALPLYCTYIFAICMSASSPALMLTWSENLHNPVKQGGEKNPTIFHEVTSLRKRNAFFISSQTIFRISLTKP